MNISTDSWEKAVYQLPEDQLFYIYRLYIGDVPTPFHKPNLIHDLKIFIQQNANRITSLLDEDDIRILSLIYFFKEVEIKEIIHFLTKLDYSLFFLQKRILNLEERLLIYVFEGTCRITPSLQENLEFYISPYRIAGEEIGYVNSDKSLSDSALLLNIQSFIAFISWVFHLSGNKKGFSKNFRPNNLPKYLKNNTVTDTVVFNFLSNILSNLQILKEDSNFNNNIVRILMKYSKENLLISLIISGIQLIDEQKYTSFAAEIVNFFHFIQSIEAPKKYFDYYLYLHIRKLDIPIETCEEIIEHMTKIHVLEKNNGQIDKLHMHTDISQALGNKNSKNSDANNKKISTILSNDFHLHIPGEFDYRYWYRCYEFAVCQNLDKIITFQINKETVLKAVDNGFPVTDIITYLENIVEVFPESLKTVMKQWEKDFLDIQLFEGLIIKAENRKKYILKNHPELQKYIYTEISDGVFLMDPHAKEEWRDILLHSGLDILPKIKNYSSMIPDSSTEKIDKMLQQSIIHKENLLDIHKPTLNELIDTPYSSKEYFNAFINSISNLKNLNAKKELESRLHDRLIVSNEQLMNCSLKKTIFEAKGFDYQGKLQLIKQAIKNKSELMEIHYNSPQSEEINSKEVFLMKPLRLEKKGETAHILTGSIFPEASFREIEVAKIFKLRKLKKSLYLQDKGNHAP
ncbi:MAG: hypothetical protein K9L24_00585 [Spirochaetia bacterium]|nr:hypothetical protein [Spirochaetia bacterium]MCF7946308.1 hypothetical protein [Spirochaetia bacterium]